MGSWPGRVHFTRCGYPTSFLQRSEGASLARVSFRVSFLLPVPPAGRIPFPFQFAGIVLLQTASHLHFAHACVESSLSLFGRPDTHMTIKAAMILAQAPSTIGSV